MILKRKCGAAGPLPIAAALFLLSFEDADLSRIGLGTALIVEEDLRAVGDCHGICSLRIARTVGVGDRKAATRDSAC